MTCLEVWGGTRAVNTSVNMPGLDAWLLSEPYQGHESGGDIHYVSSCATGRIIRLLVADVAGHGNEVASLALRLRDLMRRYVNYIDQSRFVGELNREFANVSHAGRFATAVVATYWTPTDQLRITSAGHPRPIIFRKAVGWAPLTSDQSAQPDPPQPDAAPPGSPHPRRPSANDSRDIPLGITETTYSQFTVSLDPDDLVLFHTDAVTEARTPDGRMLGESGLVDRLNALATTDPSAILTGLVAALRAHTGSHRLDDDLTALLVRPNANKPRGSLATGLAAGARLARQAWHALTRRSAAFPRVETTPRGILGAFFDRLNRRNRPM